MNAKDTEIIFASPKINPAVLNDLEPCISDLNDIFSENGFDFIFCVIANEEFKEEVIDYLDTLAQQHLGLERE